MGAIAAGGVEVLSSDLIQDLEIPAALVEQVAVRERLELDRRDQLFRGGQPFPSLRDRIAIIVDDGLATGASMEAAIVALRRLNPKGIVIAVPVGAVETCERLARLADRVVCLATPTPFSAVGQWYRDFTQTSDEEVRWLLDQYSRDRRPAALRNSTPDTAIAE
jgi:putative phosphoribosyl transferase